MEEGFFSTIAAIAAKYGILWLRPMTAIVLKYGSILAVWPSIAAPLAAIRRETNGYDR
jgi:hypothetical protein